MGWEEERWAAERACESVAWQVGRDAPARGRRARRPIRVRGGRRAAGGGRRVVGQVVGMRRHWESAVRGRRRDRPVLLRTFSSGAGASSPVHLEIAASVSTLNVPHTAAMVWVGGPRAPRAEYLPHPLDGCGGKAGAGQPASPRPLPLLPVHVPEGGREGRQPRGAGTRSTTPYKAYTPRQILSSLILLVIEPRSQWGVAWE